MTLGDRVAVMRNGLLQQVGAPGELYHRPDNLFVAGFIGSPSMNFLPATVEEGSLRTSLGDFPLTDRLRRELEGANTGRDVIVGLRPENFEDAALVPAGNRDRGITFRVSIDVVESMGSDVFVYFTGGHDLRASAAELEELARDSGSADTGGGAETTITARLDAATRIREGADAELWADGSAIHVFDPGTGRNLTLAARGDGAAPPVPPPPGAASPTTASPTVQSPTVQSPATRPDGTAG
jgi:multiple sugar transport system ATP-binding protein